MNEQSKIKQLEEKHKGFRNKLSEFAKIDKARLNQEMREVASKQYSVGEIKAAAEYEMDMAERRVELTEARVSKKIRKKYAGTKKPSEKQIEEMVMTNPGVQAAREAFIEAKWKHNVCWSAVTAIAQKGNQLTNLAYNYRKELDRGLGSKVREQKATEKGKQFMNQRKGN